jgi:transglutaminase-like putative cysteine protease
LFLVSWAGSPVLGAVPGWLRAAAQASLPKYPDDTNAVVLLGEQITTVTDAGEINTLHRQAYKILRPQGRDRGIVAVYFDNETHLTHLRGWAISADGKDYEVKEKDAIETSAFSESLYGDTRHKVLKIPAADPGSVIGYEYEQRQRPSIVQDIWPFQDDIPVRRARLELRLPPGWEYAPAWFNHGSQNAQQTGNNQWVWELTHIPAVEDEPGMPAWQALAGRLGLSFFPPRENASMKAQRSWRDVGIWYEQLAEGRRQPSLEIKQKVKELSAGAPTTLEKIAAVAKFVQKDIRYVAIEIGVGGYQPHSAQDIFTNRYGDCKDKATLLSTMLAELGVKSYYVAISHRRGVVAPEFPSPLGFDHVILALKLPDDVPTQPSMWSTMNHQELGRLLFFDPTDPLVPLGYLPETLQQNHGLLVADSGGDLVELPLLPPEANRLSRTAKLTLTPQGTLSGDVTEQRLGAPAAELRARLSGVPEAKRREHLEDFLGGFLNGAILESYSVENLEKSDAALTVQYHFKVTSYAKVAGDLLLLRPRVIGQKQEVFLEQNDKKERKAAVEFPATASQSDLVEIALPGGYKVDELPPPAKLDTGIVSYESKIAVAGDVLHYRRMYQIKNVIVPVGRVEELRNFYRQVAADERATAILKRIAP